MGHGRGRQWTRRGVLAVAGAAAIVRPAAADRGALAKLKQQGSIRIGIANNMPWSTLNPDGTLIGIAPTLVRAVVERMGIPKIEAFVAAYGELVPGLQAGRWDMIGASLTISPDRCKQVLFCDPFYRKDETQWIGYLPGTVKDPPKSFTELGAAFSLIGISKGSAELPYLQQGIEAAGRKDKVEIAQFSDTPLLYEGLTAKRVPIVTSDAKTMQLLKSQRGGIEIAPVDSGHPNRGSGGAFRLDDTDLRDAFVAEFRALKKSGEVAKILKQHDFEYDEKFMNISGEQACAL